LLTRGGFFDDAVARTYYALFHAAKAALQVHDVAADTYAGARRMFGLHLVEAGEIELDGLKGLCEQGQLLWPGRQQALAQAGGRAAW
jgi:uncharacterized protein (UPF0332 family)